MMINTMTSTSPWILGSIVAFAIFFSMTSKVPLLSSEALRNTPELFDSKHKLSIEYLINIITFVLKIDNILKSMITNSHVH